MTRAAREFITPLTFAALSGQKVITDLFTGGESGTRIWNPPIEHICRGPADGICCWWRRPPPIPWRSLRADLRTIFFPHFNLASTAPVVLAPAMNVNMWQQSRYPRESCDAAEARRFGSSSRGKVIWLVE